VGYKELKDLYHHGYAGSLQSVMEALLNGKVTGEARVLLSSAKLVALRKPNGKLRPIARGLRHHHAQACGGTLACYRSMCSASRRGARLCNRERPTPRPGRPPAL
jgi:hypothetical protein